MKHYFKNTAHLFANTNTIHDHHPVCTNVTYPLQVRVIN